ncbi:adenine deaminase [Lagierella sp.]|uniref:adenine deaminase n=1 Tax=Lagierella sp. TaxID=2849657 RepID=UPI00261C659C|nr:adenine deaminase [Lagierella sp.]
MDKDFIDVAMKRKKADLVLKNGKVIDVYSGRIIQEDLAIYKGLIVGWGNYLGEVEIDLKGMYVSPGLIDGHIHIESSYLTPEELGSLLPNFGTTTIIADPHEIVNVCGLTGLDYMIEASKNTKMDIKYVLPSCVPATPFENAGSVVEASDMKDHMAMEEVIGLGEFMNFPGVINGDRNCIDKINVAIQNKKIIDGHCPGLMGIDLNAYVGAGIVTDHECMTIEEMKEKISKGMFIQLRHGSACHDLERLIEGVDDENYHRCMFCSDDRQPETILKQGHIDNHLRIAVKKGLSAIRAIRIGTLNPSICYGLSDRGAIAPGKRADITIFKDLEKFEVAMTFIKGEKVSENGKYLFPVEKVAIDKVANSFNVKDFSVDKLKLNLKNGLVNLIEIVPGGVVTKKVVEKVEIDKNGDFKYNPEKDIVKIGVVERHRGTGNVAVGLIKGYGIKRGAVAISIAHDSHNIIVAGTNNRDMEVAVKQVIEQNGGVALVDHEKIVGQMELPIGGIMSDRSIEEVNNKLIEVHNTAIKKLGVNSNIDPIMTLCFMSLPVIPELKITDMGLFDVNKFSFIPLESQ